MRDFIFKGGLAGLGTIAAFVSGNCTPLVILLIFAEMADYITGIYSAWRNGELSSKTAKDGFFKKVFYFFLVAAAFMFDYMIFEATQLLNVQFNYPAVFGIFSICYLLSTELISIVENLGKMGIVVPFLTNALKGFREKLDGLDKMNEEENKK